MAISELGIADPERRIYQLGFSLLGLILGFKVWLYGELLKVHLVPAQDERLDAVFTKAMHNGWRAAAGCIVQGIFVLERTFSLQSVIHWGGAGLFVASTMQHAQSTEDLYQAAFAAANRSHKHVVLWIQHPRIIATQAARNKMLSSAPGYIMFCVPLLLQMITGLTGGTPLAGSIIENSMGMLQWTIILLLAVYFCTFSIDFHCAALLFDDCCKKGR